MVISNNFTEEELDILKLYCEDKYEMVNEVDGESYVFDLDGKYSYDQCFKASNNGYYKEKRYLLINVRKRFRSKEGVVCLIIVLISAFYASRGVFHRDTGIYHAQAIRIIEEYGVIKGIGNFQLHFAYNSSAYL